MALPQTHFLEKARLLKARMAYQRLMYGGS